MICLMRLESILIFLTLVWVAPAALAAPTANPQSNLPTISNAEANDDMLFVPPGTYSKIFKYKNTLAFGAGLLLGSYSYKNDSSSLFGFDFLYNRYYKRDRTWSMAGLWLADQTGQARLGHTWYIASERELRAFYDLSVGLALLPDELLATFINSRNFFVRGSLGLETLLTIDSGVRVELGALSGQKGPVYLLGLSYTYSW